MFELECLRLKGLGGHTNSRPFDHGLLAAIYPAFKGDELKFAGKNDGCHGKGTYSEEIMGSSYGIAMSFLIPRVHLPMADLE